MDKSLLAIMGSPHREGTIANVLNRITLKAEKSGWNVVNLSVYDVNLHYCIGCMRCRKTGTCTLPDGFAQIQEQFAKSDMVIIAAPTYLANIPAPLKNLLDRLVGALIDDTTNIPKPRLSKSRKYFLITACSTTFPFNYLGRQSTGALRAMSELCKIAGMKKSGQIVLSGTKNNREISAGVQNKIRRFINAL